MHCLPQVLRSLRFTSVLSYYLENNRMYFVLPDFKRLKEAGWNEFICG